MRSISPALLAALAVALAVVLGGCSGGAATTTTTVATTTLPPATTTTLPPDAARCTPGLANPNSRFVIVPEQDIFGCFGVSSFRSDTSYEGARIFPEVPESASASVTSEQVIDDTGERRARVTLRAGTAEYMTLQLGDSLFTVDGEVLTDEIPIEVFQAQLAMNQVITDAITSFMSSVRSLGPEPVGGIETTHYQASPDDIATAFEERIARDLGVDVAIELEGTQLDVWADSRGLVVQMEFIFDFARATSEGVPSPEVMVGETPLSDILPETSGSARYVLYDLGADITVELP